MVRLIAAHAERNLLAVWVTKGKAAVLPPFFVFTSSIKCFV